MRTGLYVLATFAAIWGMVALNGLDAPPLSFAAPVLISLALAVLIAPEVFASADRVPQDGRRVARLVALWSSLQVPAILAVGAALQATGHMRLFTPGISLVVGLHFLPLAHGLPFRIYYGTGVAMILTSLAALALPGAGPTVLAGAGGALILWATILAMPRVGRTAPASSR